MVLAQGELLVRIEGEAMGELLGVLLGEAVGKALEEAELPGVDEADGDAEGELDTEAGSDWEAAGDGVKEGRGDAEALVEREGLPLTVGVEVYVSLLEDEGLCVWLGAGDAVGSPEAEALALEDPLDETELDWLEEVDEEAQGEAERELRALADGSEELEAVAVRDAERVELSLLLPVWDIDGEGEAEGDGEKEGEWVAEFDAHALDDCEGLLDAVWEGQALGVGDWEGCPEGVLLLHGVAETVKLGDALGEAESELLVVALPEVLAEGCPEDDCVAEPEVLAQGLGEGKEVALALAVPLTLGLGD